MTGKFTFKGEEDNNGNGNVQEAINQVTESYQKADRELKQEFEEKISEITTGTEDYVTKKYLDEKISNQGNSFIKKGSSDDKVLLGNGGEKDLSELDNKNIQFGVRNLLRKTKEFIVNNEPYCMSYTWSNNAGIITNETFNNNVVRKINGDWQGVKANIPDILGEPVVISFWAKTNGKGNFGNYANKNKNTNHIEDFTKYSNDSVLINDNQWHRYTIYNPKGMCLGEGISNGFIEFYNVSGDIYYSSIKIEYGNTPTDWSPAPEDLESKVPQYKTIKDAHTFLDNDASIFFGSGSNISNAPSGHFYEMLGLSHSDKRWGFIIAKNIDDDDKGLYIKQVIGGTYKEWFKLEDRSNERTINVTASTFNITSDIVGKTLHINNNCTVNYNDMPLLTTVAIRKVFDGGEVKFTGAVEAIYTGDRVLNGKKGSTAIIDFGSSINMIFIDIRNI